MDTASDVTHAKVDSSQLADHLEFLGSLGIIDTHIHLSKHFQGGLKNVWHPAESNEGFHRDFTEEDYLASVAKGVIPIKSAIFVECFNDPPIDEAKWALSMVEDPQSIVVGVVAHAKAQEGEKGVNNLLDQLRLPDGSLPKGLKGARCVFMAAQNQQPCAPLEPDFHEGLAALEKAGLHWEMCCKPYMAPNLADACSKFPNMTFVIDHIAHNGNEEGQMDQWGPAIDALGKLPNVYAKMGAVEEWDVDDPGPYMDRALAAFGFDRVLYESNWFVSEALGQAYDKTALLLFEACKRAGATEDDLTKVFRDNAKKVYRLD